MIVRWIAGYRGRYRSGPQRVSHTLSPLLWYRQSDGYFRGRQRSRSLSAVTAVRTSSQRLIPAQDAGQPRSRPMKSVHDWVELLHPARPVPAHSDVVW